MHTVAHVTHEAIQKIGGIGAVLQGLLTSRTYLAGTKRNILVGPYWPTGQTGDTRLGSGGEVLYSGLDGINRTPLGAGLRAIESKFGVNVVYGRRKFSDRISGVISVPEVLLIDVSRFDEKQISQLKFRLWEKYGLSSSRYDSIWDFEQWMRLAAPAIEGLRVLGAANPVDPTVILSHEYMGMPTVLTGLLDENDGAFRAVFYAHEVATMRRIIEHHPGHDTMFYNAMRLALPREEYVEDVFGSQDDYYKHALIKLVKYCDEIFGVGDFVLKEFRFMGPAFSTVDASLAYNGVPHFTVDASSKLKSREKLLKYAQNLLKFKPDFVFSHVTRLVPSKALWRDLRVLEHLEPELRKRNESAILFVLSTEVGTRRSEDVRHMEHEYDWPLVHREGSPDLSGGEAYFYQFVQRFNIRSRNIKVVFINQFGFDAHACGDLMPADMEFMDIRKGTDVEFGQSIYEPFGIAQVEPISFGGICVYTNICGCAGFVARAARSLDESQNGGTLNAIVADYTKLPDELMKPERILSIDRAARHKIEHVEADRVAREILRRVARTAKEIEPFIERGQKLADRMSWDVVAREFVIPGIERAARAHRLETVV